MFEKHHEQLLPAQEFRRRVLRFAALALGITMTWWGVGILGYHVLGNLDWIDAILNAAMILGGMGPVDALTSPAAKLFASVYAITSGIVFIAATGLLFSPIIHRVYHHFHLDVESDADEDDDASGN
ncbi:MAG: hypothetical protein HY868_17545 [Chloroflexi bacterium]|nr:hypothetical protein [Chloroflexota bacterium]